MKRYLLLAFCLLVLVTITQAQSSASDDTSPSPEHRQKWRLVWSDEFTSDGMPDPNIWNYAVGGHGWGNKELQYYTEARKDNIRQEGGVLIIEARKEPWQKNEFTSARINTRGKRDNTYGRWEIRARWQGGKGTWPALWLNSTGRPYGNHNWPDNGEVDIMEHVGWAPGKIHGTLHCHAYNHVKHTEKQWFTMIPDFDQNFHVYAVEISDRSIKWFVDDKSYGEFKNDGKGDWRTWPFDVPQHVILNYAVGGWGAMEGGVDDSIFPRRMEVDYVRFFEPKK